MSNEISILIRAKAMLGQGFAQANRELSAWSKNIQKHTALARSFFGGVATAALGAATAIVAFATKAIMAFSENERAVRKLQEAHRAFGEEVNATVAGELKLAKAMQEETGIAKDTIITSMAELRMLGVKTDKLEEAAKATVALTYAGLGEEGAARMVAMAYEGNYTRLARYIPALKEATSETEKASIVNAFLARNYQAQQGQVTTLAGAWESFKNTLHDALEEAGKKLNDSGALQTALIAIKGLVQQVSQAFSEWAASGGVGDFISGTIAQLENMREILWDIRHLGHSVGAAINSDSESGDIVADEMARRVKAEKWINDLRDKMNASVRKGDSGADGSGTSTGAKPAPMNIAGAGIVNGNEEATKKFYEEIGRMNKDDAEERQRNAEKEAKEKEDLHNRGMRLIEHDEAAIAALHRREEEKQIEATDRRLNKELRAAERLARMTVSEYIAKQKNDDAWRRQEKKNMHRGIQLEAKQRRDVRLSARDEQWLQAQHTLRQARAAVPSLQGHITLNQSQRDRLAVDGAKNLKTLVKEVRDTRAALVDLEKLK